MNEQLNIEGLIPAVIQDAQTLEVLMLGYMNQEAWEKTKLEKRVTFFSRSKQRLWTKGEASGHFLDMVDWKIDCDGDTLLIKAVPHGPTCHTGHRNCFQTELAANFIFELEQIIDSRYKSEEADSYITRLREQGLNKIAQKVGEEGVETVIAALAETRPDFVNEASDLLFHLMVLLKEKGVSLEEIAVNLQERHKQKK
ncbi:MAG TPA: bifunctional phosphoribosyl-AMP cyclohydrolase/phosphoribosyl-ATP diphosphatase HisIE [Sphingobacteriaceae bacterium]|nr:bifunctional phosphoribosyl-AMP cyclohydrolase/phosphoribosyl-ATP diphosphatase HisIE [Sphingobacteriaceae bacterium]